MEIIVLILRCLLSAVFALAAVGKLVDRQGAEKAARGFGVPDPMVRLTVFGLPIVELAIVFALLFPEISWHGGILAASLLLLFTAGMLYQFVKGNAPDCHCFGQIHSEPVGVSSIVRNIVFLLMAGFVVLQGVEGQGIALAVTAREMVQVAGIASALMAALAATLIASQAKKEQQKLTRRIEMLEVLSGGEEGAILHNEASDPNDGLPIGTPLPKFELASAHGQKVESTLIAGSDKSSLLFFVGPDCNPCTALYPEIEEWAAEFGDKLDLWIVSRGDGDVNLEKFNGSLSDRLLLQSEREVAELLRARWTPTAVLVGPTGRIASNPAVGDNLIRELVEKIRFGKISDEFANFRVGPAAGRKNFVGKVIPQFSVEDIYGKTVTDADLKGKETLLVFLSKSCSHCSVLIEDIRRREQEGHPSAKNIIIFNDADLDELKEYGLRPVVIHDPGFSLSKTLGMYGAPSAVLVNKEGKFMSEAAIGATNIWALRGEIGGVKA